MAISPDDLLSTPSGYATPEQLASVQEYAKQLMQGATRDKPITSPWQGVRMMADALSGNILRNRAGQQQIQNAALLGGQQADAMGKAFPQQNDPLAGMGQSSDIDVPQPKPQISPIPTGVGSTPQPGSYGNLPPQAVDAIRKQEGYAPKAQWDVHQYTYGYGSKAPGPGAVATRSQSEELLNRDLSQAAALVDQVNPRLDPGTRAALTDLTFNTGIGWSRQGLGQAVRAGDLQGIKQGLLQYQNVAGHPNPVIANRRQMDAGWIGQPGAQVAQAGPAPGVGAPSPNAPAPMSAALAGQQTAQAAPQQVAASGRGGPAPIGGQPGPPTAGNPQFGPQYMQQRPQISLETLRGLLQNPILDPEMKRYYMQLYQEQFQPVTAPGTGGTWIMPGRAPGAPPPGLPTFVPGIQNVKPGGGRELPGYMTPDMKMHIPGIQYEGGGGGTSAPEEPPDIVKKFNTPGTQGNAAPQGNAPSPGFTPATGGRPPTMLGATPPSASKPVQVASLDPTIGVGKQPPQASAQPAPAGTQVAQAPFPQSPLGPFIGGLDKYDKDTAAYGAGREESAKKFSSGMEEERQAASKVAEDTQKQMSELQLARGYLDDPNLSAGFLSKQRGQIKQAQAFIGKNPDRNRINEVFDKIISREKLPEMRAQTVGTGQVRNMELNIVNNSIASRDLTTNGAKAVIDIMLASHQQNIDIGNLMNAYAQGYRMDNSGKLVKQPGASGFDYGWQPTLQRYLEQHPVITPELRANWEREFHTNLNDAASKAVKTGGTPKAAPTAGPPAGWAPGSPEPPPGVTIDRK